MPFHICADEIIAFMMMFPFVGMFIRTYRDKIHGWFHTVRGATKRFFKRECPHDHGGYRKSASPQQVTWWSWLLGKFSRKHS